ncbi:conditioned medium-induced protein 4 [Haloplanus halobius]|uniref:conditioned medium-induced protein 4 n=1 Tax=Haloplanus halobius TaxID=2934938 RepID=UPI00200EDC70|nr:conditioned medium-induced protein 4 [Haloplanus sp. XH21]
MDEKTEELRDIFLDATGEESVTERQAETPGSLVDDEKADEEAARLHDLLDPMREQYAFDTDLSADAYARLIRGFYNDASDAALAAALGIDEDRVERARLDLHLVRESDRDHPDYDAVRAAVVDGADDATIADEHGLDTETVAALRRVVDAERTATRANDRFRDAFAELLTDADLSDHLASDSRKDGLQEATEDIETDVSF